MNEEQQLDTIGVVEGSCNHWFPDALSKRLHFLKVVTVKDALIYSLTFMQMNTLAPVKVQ